MGDGPQRAQVRSPALRLLDSVAPPLCRWAETHARLLGWGLLLVLATLALTRLPGAFRDLVSDRHHAGDRDIWRLHRWVNVWFAGRALYGEDADAVYPPASLTLIAPFFWERTLESSRALWGGVTALALAALAWGLARWSGLATALARQVVAALTLAIAATMVTIGHGQLGIVVLLLVLIAIGEPGSRADAASARPRGRLADLRADARSLLCGLAFTAALAKPSLSVPFLWHVALAPRRARNVMALTLCVVLAGATLFAASFQETGLVTLHREWLANAVQVSGRYGYGNVASVLGAIGLGSLSLPLGAAMVLALGAWLWRGDFEPRVGVAVTALVARLATYHELYDDLLLLFPLAVLLGMAGSAGTSHRLRVAAGTLFVLGTAGLLVPATVRFARPPWTGIYTGGQTTLFVLELALLVSASGASARLARSVMLQFDSRGASGS